MTTPVEIRKDTHTRRGDGEAFSMRFPIGQKYTTERYVTLIIMYVYLQISISLSHSPTHPLTTHTRTHIYTQKYSAPRPSDAKVRLTTTPPKERVAVKEFPGFATEGEVQRQLISLLSALDREGVEVVGGGGEL